MTIVPVNLPPGMFRNGTPYAARGRWIDGNLIRWHDNALRPIGGWQKLQKDLNDVPPLVSDPTTETVRDSIAYTTNSGSVQSIWASNSALYLLNPSNEIVPITTTGFTPGPNQPTNLFGYGIGPYGRYAYNTPRNNEAAQTLPVQRWALDTWGENVLAAGRNSGPIFEITPDGTATALSNAPTDVADVITTDQRIVMAIKNDATDIRQVIWSDREDNTEWAPAAGNYAGSQKLQGTGPLLGLYKVLGQVLILSAADAHVGRYIGAPFVYGFERVGNNCGPVHPDAVAKTDRFAVWLGERSFWMYDGTIKQVSCDVVDYVFETISRENISKIWTLTMPAFSEIWWFYQSKGGTEVDSYVVFDYEEGHWTTGQLARTSGVPRFPYPNPLICDPNGQIWQHEIPSLLVDGDAFAVSGPIELENGNRNTAVRYVFPDTESFGSVEVAFLTRQMPTEPDTVHGPYEYRNPISTTGVLGREIRMLIRGTTVDWEVGTMRWDIQPIGGGLR